MYVMLDVVPIVAERSSACAQSSEGPHGAFIIVQAVGLTPERLPSYSKREHSILPAAAAHAASLLGTRTMDALRVCPLTFISCVEAAP